MVHRPIVARRFIGRRDELAFLHERRREAGLCHGGLVLLAGEAGLGKSRLLTEFARALAKSRYRVAQSACLEYAQRPYGPILGLLGRLDPAAVDMTPATSKYEQFETIADAFARNAARSAIVAIVEDIHWADIATMELLIHLSARLASMRMLVVASLRPEEFHSEHPSYAGLAKLARSANATRIDLPPLDVAEQRLFIDEALQDIVLPADTRREVARASEGNPFFLEELLKSAVERAANPAWRAGAALPPTLHATLMERIRPLTEPERLVLEQAAVIGRYFDVGVLAQTLEREPDALLSALRRARTLQLIEEDGPARFHFRHALTREAIYGGFLSAELRTLHQRIALVIEKSDDRSIEGLAYHWTAAGNYERAARYNEEAGDAAAAVHAHDDAIAFYARAVEALGDDASARARVLEKTAERRFALAQFSKAAAANLQAADAYAEAGELDAEARCRAAESMQEYALGRPDPASGLVAMLERVPREASVPRARLHVGIAWLLAGKSYEPTAATRHLDEVDLSALARAPDIGMRYHNVRAWVAMLGGELKTFRTEHEAWLRTARAFGTFGQLAAAHYNGAYAYALLAQHEDAERNVDAALRIAEREHSPHIAGSALGVGALCAVLRGDLRTARDRVDCMSPLYGENEAVYAHATGWGTLAGFHLADAAMIERWFDGARPGVAARFPERVVPGHAAVLAGRGRLEEARAMLHAAIGPGERHRGDFLTMLAVARYGDEADFPGAREILRVAADVPHETVESYALGVFDAVVAHRLGRHQEARDHASAAVPGLRKLRFPLLEAEALELSGDIDRALTVYQSCGAVYDLRRLGRREKNGAAWDGTHTHAEGIRKETGTLSARELQIAELVAAGCSNMEVAHRLAISQKTVEKHLGSAFQKLGLASRAQLAAYVARRDATA